MNTLKSIDSRVAHKLQHLSACLALFIIVLTSHPTSASAQRQLFRRYGSSEGLSNLNVRCLFQDQTGYIWVGTDNGLFRYDGNRFRSFGHSDGLFDTEILSIGQSPDGVLWVGTNGGAAIFDGSTTFSKVDFGVNGIVHAIAFDSDRNIYIQTDSGIIKGSKTAPRAYRFEQVVDGEVSGLAIEAEDLIYGQDGNLWRLRGNEKSKFDSKSGLPFDHWSAIIKDSLGNTWVRSRTRLYELQHDQIRFTDKSLGVASSRDGRLYADRHGKVFVPTVAGITILGDSHPKTIDTHHGLPADVSGPMLIDREDLLWAGTDGAGLVRRLGHGDWLSWTSDDGLPRNSVWAIQSDESAHTWVGTNGGLSIIAPSGEIGRTWSSRNGLAGDRVLSIIRGTKNDLYVGTEPGGISHFDAHGNLVKTFRSEAGLLSTKVSSMAIDHAGYLWALGDTGCYRSSSPLDQGPFKLAAVSIPGLPNHTIFRQVLALADDSVWLATSRGLAHLAAGSWHIYTTSDGLRSSDLGLVTQTGQTLWIAYRDALGITRLTFNGDTPTAFHITTQNGLRSDAVYAIARDRHDALWVSTDMGVDILDQQHWKHLGSENGLVWDDTDSLALHVDSSDQVWIGTSGGLSRYSQTDLSRGDAPVPVVLTSIAGSSREWPITDNLTLPYTEKSVSISYAALTYDSESTSRFRYRLVGSDNEWTETAERSVHFAGLPAGRYIFEVTSATANGGWNLTPAHLAFVVTPPWWKTWWFLASSILMFAWLVAIVVRVRLKRLEAQTRELEKQVADRTAELVTSHKQLEEIAYFDMLTSLPNRRRFTEVLDGLIAQRGFDKNDSFALLLLDLDLFKYVNDTFGHDAGDKVLIETAARINSLLPEADFAARLGGDEFAIVISRAADVMAVEDTCNQLLEALMKPIAHKLLTLQVGCSIGISRFPIDGTTQEGLYKSADLALYHAKQRKGSTFSWKLPSKNGSKMMSAVQ